MYVYKIDMIRKGAFEDIGGVLLRAEELMNEWAKLGWELDKLMPMEQNGYSSGAILVFRQSVDDSQLR